MSSNKTALIVDDSKLSRTMISTILKQSFPDWEVLEAVDAEEALELNTLSIDLITLDMNMPGMDGVALGNKLRKRFPKASISLITANTQNEVREMAEISNLYFIAKPITEEKIFEAVKYGVPSQNKSAPGI